MARQMSTFKLQDKSVRLNCKEKVYVQMARQSLRLNGKTKVYV